MMMVEKYFIFVVLFLLTSCSLSPNTVNTPKKLATDMPPMVLLLTSFISPTRYDGQNAPAKRVSEEETMNLIEYDALSPNQRDIILYIFQYLNKRINRKEVVLSLDESYSVKEIKKMIENNKKAVDLPRNKIKKQWSIIVNRLKEIKGFENQNPTIFLLLNKYKVRKIVADTFNIQGASISHLK